MKSKEDIMRPIFINRTQLRELLSTTDTPISHPSIKKWENDGVIPKPKGHGNTAVYSIEELSAMIGESKENIWQFLSDLSKRDSVA